MLWPPAAKNWLIWKDLDAGKDWKQEKGLTEDDGWMASLTQWTWVWVNSGNWWWTWRPGMLRFKGSQRVRRDWVTELTELNVDNGDLLQKVPWTHCYNQWSQPCSRPLPTHTSAWQSWTLTGKSGSVLVGLLLLSPGSWSAQGFVCALQESVSQSCGSSGSSVVGIILTSSKRAYAIPRSTAPKAPAPVAVHCWPIPPQEIVKHSSVSVSVGFLGTGCTRFFWALWVSLAGMELDSKCDSAPPTVLTGLLRLQKSIYFCFIDYVKDFDCVDQNKLWKILKEMGIPDHPTYLLRNLYAGQEAMVWTGHGTTDWFQIGKGFSQGCILSSCLFNLYAEYIMRNVGLDEA